MKPQYIEIDHSGCTYYYSDKAMKVLHREDGPAIMTALGSKHWYKNGKHHREEGPAIIFCDGCEQWWLNGVKLTEREFLYQLNSVTELTLDEIAAKFGIPVTNLKIKK